MDTNKTTNTQVNKLCGKCVRNCRQAETVLLLDCPRFTPRPFKSEELKFSQMDLFGASSKDD